MIVKDIHANTAWEKGSGILFHNDDWESRMKSKMGGAGTHLRGRSVIPETRSTMGIR